MDNISKIFPNMAAELDEDLGNVSIQPDSQQKSQEDELLEYFGRFNLEGSECTTPISGLEMAWSNPDSSEDKQTVEIENMSNNVVNESQEDTCILSFESNNAVISDTDEIVSPISSDTQYSTGWYTRRRRQGGKNKTPMYKSNLSEMNYSGGPTPRLGSDKWASEKEKFLDGISVRNENSVDNSNKKDKQKLGTVTIKESFIELPRIGRISKSFHGKSPSKDSFLDIEPSSRRASGNVVNLPSTSLNYKLLSSKHTDLPQPTEKSKQTRPKFCTQKSQPCPISPKQEIRKSSLSEPQNLKGARFTTTLVDESMFLEGIKYSCLPGKLSNEKYESD